MRYTVFALRHQSDSRKMNQNIESGDMSSQEKENSLSHGTCSSFCVDVRAKLALRQEENDPLESIKALKEQRPLDLEVN